MTYAAESAKTDKRPITVVEIDLDKCARVHPASVSDSDTIAAFNDNFLKQSEKFDGTSWSTSGTIAVATAADTPPAGSNTVYTLTDNDAVAEAYIYQTISGGTLTDASQHVYYLKVKEGTSSIFKLSLRDTTAAAFRGLVRFEWVAGDLTVKASVVGTGSVSEIGSGWWQAIVTTTSVTGANAHEARIAPAGDLVGDTGSIIATAAMLHAGTTVLEYQLEDARDSSETNVRLTTGGLTYDAEIGDQLRTNGNNYAIIDNGTNYVRVTGDATGEAVSSDTKIDNFCDAEDTDDECYNTRVTCQDTTNYDDSDTLTCRWCESRLSSAEQVEMDAIACVRSCRRSPARMQIGEGLGQRAEVSVTLRDFPHHDRGIDPYVTERSYTPELQGSYFGKLRARNPYYQGRPMRVKVGYVTSPIDLTNNFKTHNYVIERISGPDSKARVTITGKDVLKEIDDERSQIPAANTGVLSADIASDASSATLSPTGIGNSEYAASGTIRIGSELITFTRSGDTLTLTGRGQNGTTAAAHDEGDSVQECYVISDEQLDDVLYDIMVTQGPIASTYVDTSAWDTEVTDWLSGHTVSGIISEPTGVHSIVNELCAQFLTALWWDDETQKIDLKALAPSSRTFDELTDTAHLIADSVKVTDDPSKRLSQVWVYYDIIDPTGDLEEPRNYRVLYVYDDPDAESSYEYDETRVKTFFCRFFTSSADALRLGARTLMRFRNNPRKIAFQLAAVDDYQPGDVVEVTTGALQDVAGADVTTKVELTNAQDVVPGHSRGYEGEEYAFEGRYFIFGPSDLPDYGSATDEQKALYGFFSDATDKMSDGEDGYKIV